MIGEKKMKAILVIDMPTNCMDCPMCQLSDWDGEYHCFGVNSDEVNFKGDKPVWCPLRPLPRKLTEADISWGEQRGYRGGWNNCLAKITGETE